MSEASVNQIQPGLCPIDPLTQIPMCPPYNRIECVVVNKVYDSCFQVDNKTMLSVLPAFSPAPQVGDSVPCLQAGAIRCRELSRVELCDGFFTITVQITIPMFLVNPSNPSDIVEYDFIFSKTVTLCCPEGAELDCSESSLIMCNCFVTAIIGEDVILITCDVQVCVVLKCILRVQLLVPSYGFCVPAPCITLPGVCPPSPPQQCF